MKNMWIALVLAALFSASCGEAPAGSCHACTTPGQTRCSGQAYQACMDTNQDGCLEWTTPQACPSGQACLQNSCSACQNGKCDSQDGCADDTYEDNDIMSSARSISVGTSSNLMICANDPDFFSIYAQQGQTVTTRVNFVHASGDIDMNLYDPDGNIMGSSTSRNDSEELSKRAPKSGNYVIQVYAEGQAQNTYSLNVSVDATQCQDDAYEDNDNLSSPRSISAGNISNLKVCANDPDYYSISLSQGQELTVRVVFKTADGDLELKLYDPDKVEIGSSATTTDNEELTKTAQKHGQHILYVYGSTTAENSYDLQLTVGNNGGSCNDDGYEDNDDRYNARSVSEGTISNLKICTGDPDYYSTHVQEGRTLTARIDFSHAQGDLDLKLYNPSGVEIGSSTSNSNNEELSRTAQSTGTHYIHVHGQNNTNNTSYNLQVSLQGSGGGGSDGDRYMVTLVSASSEGLKPTGEDWDGTYEATCVGCWYGCCPPDMVAEGNVGGLEVYTGVILNSTHPAWNVELGAALRSTLVNKAISVELTDVDDVPPDDLVGTCAGIITEAHLNAGQVRLGGEQCTQSAREIVFKFTKM